MANKKNKINKIKNKQQKKAAKPQNNKSNVLILVYTQAEQSEARLNSVLLTRTQSYCVYYIRRGMYNK